MNLESFFERDVWGSDVEKERRLRIQLAVYAYAYELKNVSVVSDAKFDEMCKQVNLAIDTGNKIVDSYYKKHFDASTGQWIHKHPELKKIAQLYERFYK